MRLIEAFNAHQIAVVRWIYGFLQDWCNLSHHGAVRVFLALEVITGFLIWETERDALPVVGAVMVSAIKEYVHAVAPSQSKRMADVGHVFEVFAGITTLFFMGLLIGTFVTGKANAELVYRVGWQFGVSMLVCDPGEDDNERGRKIKEALNALKGLLGPKQHLEPAVGLN